MDHKGGWMQQRQAQEAREMHSFQRWNTCMDRKGSVAAWWRAKTRAWLTWPWERRSNAHNSLYAHENASPLVDADVPANCPVHCTRAFSRWEKDTCLLEPADPKTDVDAHPRANQVHTPGNETCSGERTVDAKSLCCRYKYLICWVQEKHPSRWSSLSS